jgi:hypothetical protein
MGAQARSRTSEASAFPLGHLRAMRFDDHRYLDVIDFGGLDFR